MAAQDQEELREDEAIMAAQDQEELREDEAIMAAQDQEELVGSRRPFLDY